MGGLRFSIRPSVTQTKRKVKPTCKRKEKENVHVSSLTTQGVVIKARESDVNKPPGQSDHMQADRNQGVTFVSR